MATPEEMRRARAAVNLGKKVTGAARSPTPSGRPNAPNLRKPRVRDDVRESQIIRR